MSAVDGSWRAETPLTITVQDQNDNAPEFEHSFYSFNLAELQRSVAFVGQVRNTKSHLDIIILIIVVKSFIYKIINNINNNKIILTIFIK